MEEFDPVLACCRRISRGSGNNLGELFQKICHWGRYALNLQNNLESLLKMNFQLIGNAEGSNARAGLIDTDHGQIETPIFMPVGTLGAIKAVGMNEVRNDIKAQIILGNTYHLYLRPGMDIIEKAGGLHKFNGWDRPILTDSGGFRCFHCQKTENSRKKECISEATLTAQNTCSLQRK